jgi:hypothetical protein
MPMLTQPAFGPRVAITFITAGALIDVWTAVWYYAYIRPQPGPMTSNQWFWIVGLFLTGLTFIVIGAFLGSIGRAARKAEMPPPEATRAEAQIQAAAAANPHPAVAGAAAVPGAVPGAAPAAPAAPPAGVVPTTPVAPGQPYPRPGY